VTSNYWSSTTYATDPSSAWFVDFDFGFASFGTKVNPWGRSRGTWRPVIGPSLI
jgi:hypothetical protein